MTAMPRRITDLLGLFGGFGPQSRRWFSNAVHALTVRAGGTFPSGWSNHALTVCAVGVFRSAWSKRRVKERR